MSFDYTRLITDRTKADVDRLETLSAKSWSNMTEAEKTEWVAGMKGAYNAADLNRVTEAIEYIKSLYEHYGGQVSYTPVYITHEDGTTDTTWRNDDIPTDEQLGVIVQNLHSLWSAAESAEGAVVELWSDTQFGYVDMEATISAGDYVSFSAACGIAEIIVSAQGNTLSGVVATGTGWEIAGSGSEIVATYVVPAGVFQDIQAALDSLVFLTNADDYANVTVVVTALMRSGGTMQIGIGEIRWSAIINWSALEAYAYTWQDIEDANMTWEDLERLPIPQNGGVT